MAKKRDPRDPIRSAATKKADDDGDKSGGATREEVLGQLDAAGLLDSRVLGFDPKTASDEHLNFLTRILAERTFVEETTGKPANTVTPKDFQNLIEDAKDAYVRDLLGVDRAKLDPLQRLAVEQFFRDPTGTPPNAAQATIVGGLIGGRPQADDDTAAPGDAPAEPGDNSDPTGGTGEEPFDSSPTPDTSEDEPPDDDAPADAPESDPQGPNSSEDKVAPVLFGDTEGVVYYRPDGSMYEKLADGSTRELDHTYHDETDEEDEEAEDDEEEDDNEEDDDDGDNEEDDDAAAGGGVAQQEGDPSGDDDFGTGRFGGIGRVKGTLTPPAPGGDPDETDPPDEATGVPIGGSGGPIPRGFGGDPVGPDDIDFVGSGQSIGTPPDGSDPLVTNPGEQGDVTPVTQGRELDPFDTGPIVKPKSPDDNDDSSPFAAILLPDLQEVDPTAGVKNADIDDDDPFEVG